jgi:hypothetical protein
MIANGIPNKVQFVPVTLIILATNAFHGTLKAAIATLPTIVASCCLGTTPKDK